MQARHYGTRSVALVLAICIASLWAPSSGAAATQIGETFDPTGSVCVNDSIRLQSVSPGDQYAAQFAGVITSWSFQANASPPSGLKLKVGRSAGGNSFTIVGESVPKNPTPNALNTYTDVQIPVQAGDVIGTYSQIGGACAAFPDGFTTLFLTGDQAVGTSAAYMSQEGLKIDASALLEPDCDSDGRGDETQDPDVPPGGPCPIRDRTVTLDASKNKVKKGKKVTLSGQLTEFLRAGECQATQTVELQRKKPSQSTFTTVEQLQTDAAGNFTAQKKVKKTFEYRAQVSETATCGGQVSSTEKIKVKKPK